MRIIFMGTPDFAVPSLRALASRHEVTLALTRPDAVRGRGRRLEPSPVKVAAGELGIPVVETKRVTPEVLDRLRAERPDAICVAAYGCILPDEVLGIAPLGCVNVHGSLLPRWRGAAPIQRAILAGDERAGVSIMRVAHDLDAGAYCRQASTEVGEKGCDDLMSELAQLGASELLAALDNRRRVQTSSDAAPSRLEVSGRGLRAMRASVAPGDVSVAGGEVLVRKGRVFLGCSDGALELLRVKPDGKREMEASAWAAGLHAKALTWGVA